MSGTARDRRAGRLVAALGAVAVVALAATVRLDGAPVGSRLGMLAAFTGAVAATWARPLFVLHRDETEVLVLDEAFLVVMAFLLPPGDVVLALALGTGLGLAARRRPPVRVVFNMAATTVAATVAFALMDAVAAPDGPVTAATVLAVLLGAITFSVVEAAAVCAVIAVSEGRPLRDVVVDSIRSRLLVLAGNCSIGLLAGLACREYPWALVPALVPLAVLQRSYAAHLRSRHDRRRLDGLLETTVRAQNAIAYGSVEDAVCERVRDVLDCTTARFDTAPPAPGEIGAAVPPRPGITARWLIAADRRGFEPLDEADAGVLGATVALTATALEIAALYRATDAERVRLADVIASSSDGIFSVGPDQAITSWNPAMARITGVPEADAIGAPAYTTFRPRRHDGTVLGPVDDPAAAGLTGEPVPLEITAASGTSQWLSCAFAPLLGGGYVVTARDVTAEHRVDLLQSAISTVSHELRTPITPIKGFAETLIAADSRLSPDERREVYTRMLRQSEQLERLVRDLWDSTFEDAGERTYLAETLDWTVAAAEVVDGFVYRAPDRRILLAVGPGVPAVTADPLRAVQVLSNLLDNAAKYSYPGHPIRVAIRLQGDDVVTTVSDEGPGVPEAERERVFEQFSRLDTATRTTRGIGLGLHLVRRLVEGMGGRTTVTRSAEGGAAFSFTLPVAGTRVHRPANVVTLPR